MSRMKWLMVFLVILTGSTWSESALIVADEWPQMEILKIFLQDEGHYDVAMAEQTKLPEKLSDYLAVFMFVHGALDLDAAQRMIEYVQNGGRLVVMHHGISSQKRKVPEWLDLLGIFLPEKEQEPENFYTWIHDRDYFLVNLNPNHYITSNKVTWPTTVDYRSSDSPSRKVNYPAWEIKNSEVFLNHHFQDGREKVILCGFMFQDPQNGEIFMQDRGGWYKRSGRGWVFYFQPGHTPIEFQERNYCQMILNCMTWNGN